MPQDFPKDQIKFNRNRSAATYNEAAVLQTEVADRLLERLDYMKIDPKVVLDLGAATGYSLPFLQRRFPKAKVIGVDLSWGLLNRVQQKWWRKKSLKVCADKELLPLAANSVDLIYSNLDFYALSDPTLCLQEARRVLKPGGLILFTTFGPDTLKELRQSFTDAYPHVLEFMDMHHWGDAMLATGWQDPVVDMEFLTLSYSDLNRLIKDIRGSGAKNIHPERFPALMPPSRWKAMQESYAKFCFENGQFPATFELIYGHAWKTEDKSSAGLNDQGEALIPIQSIRRK